MLRPLISGVLWAAIIGAIDPIRVVWAADAALIDAAQKEGAKQGAPVQWIAMAPVILAPPGVPTDRVAALRAAFDAAMRDPDLHEDAKKGGLSVTTGVSGLELEQIVRDLMSTPPDLVEKMNALMQ
jgi:hypothetical protein